jgi:hypothetical protein
MTDEKAKMADKVRKLLAKAHGTDSEAEAAAFAAKAHSLMAEHMLSMTDLEQAEEKLQGLVHDKLYTKYDDAWRRILASAVAKYYLCGMYRWPGQAYVFVGRKDRAEVARLMYDYLQQNGVRLSKDYAKRTGDKRRHDFEKGYGLGLAKRLRELTEAAMKPAPAKTGTNLPALYQTALVEVQQEFAGMKMKTTASRAVTFRSSDAYSSGREASKTVNLNDQVGARASTASRIGAK